jgi:hypothetical protein
MILKFTKVVKENMCVVLWNDAKDQWCETKGGTRQWCCLRKKHCKMKVLKDNGDSKQMHCKKMWHCTKQTHYKMQNEEDNISH